MGEEIKRVLDLMEKAVSSQTPLKIWDFDKNSYLVLVSETDRNDPFYIVYKKAPFVRRYSSGEDPDKFFSAAMKSPIWETGGEHSG